MSMQYFLAQAQSATDQLTEGADQAVTAVTSFWNDPTVQQWLVAIPLKILGILVIATIIHWLLRRVVNKLARENIKNGGKRRLTLGRGVQAPEETSHKIEMMNQTQEKRRQSRVRTIAGVFNSAIAIVVWVWAVLAILDQLTINVAPLIASAGVVGVALGFGAQSLVKDFLSGIFMLIEDQYGIGDTIDVGDGIIGDVEDISLRITTIRDIDGGLWYVRNGEILRVGNLSDGYAIARLEIPVALTNDTDKAWQVIEDAIKEETHQPELARLIIEEPTMNGVSELNPDYITYRVSIKTLPGDQWTVQRRLQSSIVNILRAEGIDMPYPHGIGAAHAVTRAHTEKSEA